MPKRLSSESVKNEFNRYGYSLPDDFKHINNTTKYKVYDEYNNKHISLSLKQLRYKVSKGRSEYKFPDELMNIKFDDAGANIKKSAFKRFLDSKDESFKNRKPEYQHKVFDQTQKYIKEIMKQKPFTIDIKNNAKNTIINSLMYAFEITGKNIPKNIRITIKDELDRVQYLHVNQNTINYLKMVLKNDIQNIGDSGSIALDSINNVKSIYIDFINKTSGKRINPGFFPYINISNINLTKYGIFDNINNENINNSCLIQAFMASGLFSIDQINLLKSFINTRNVYRSALKDISKLFNIHIKVKV